MQRKREKKTSLFTESVLEIVKSIPYGRVCTYGMIAAMAGHSKGARQVVRILHTCSHTHALPWHRVVNREGRISLRPGYGYEEQKSLLEQEGVVFDHDDCIALDTYCWLIS